MNTSFAATWFTELYLTNIMFEVWATGVMDHLASTKHVSLARLETEVDRVDDHTAPNLRLGHKKWLG